MLFRSHGMRLSDDGRTLYAAHIGQPSLGLVTGAGLRIHDVSQIQDRAKNPQAPILSTMTWHGMPRARAISARR